MKKRASRKGTYVSGVFRFVRRAFRGALLFAISVLLAAPGLPAIAQEFDLEEKMNQAEAKLPNPANGLALSRKLCLSCHLIGEAGNSVTPADVPSFPSIANRRDQSAGALTNWLLAPHTPMPDPHLTQKEIRDLAAYILSLRKAE